MLPLCRKVRKVPYVPYGLRQKGQHEQYEDTYEDTYMHTSTFEDTYEDTYMHTSTLLVCIVVPYCRKVLLCMCWHTSTKCVS